VNEIVRLEMQPFVERVIIDGKRTMISAKHAQYFSLAVHELATNANKYGALSNERGKVGIFWTVSRQGNANLLKFKWREEGGPPVTVPTHQGFGTVLLKATFPNARIDFTVEGLNCEIDVLLGEDMRGVAEAS
jgi:two-component sensor histidine kinase